MGGLHVGAIWLAGFYILAGHKGQPVVWNAYNLHLYLVTGNFHQTWTERWTFLIFFQILFHLRNWVDLYGYGTKREERPLVCVL